MGKLRPEDLVQKPVATPKGGEGGKEQKKIPPKLILIGGGVAVLILCVVMMSSAPKKPPQTVEAKNAAIEKGKAEIAAAQEKKSVGGAVVVPGQVAPAENVAQLDSEIAKADATLKSIAQHVAAIDAELREYSQASERLGQVGDREGKRDADRQVAVLTQKRKEYEASHAKWTAYREELQGQKTAVVGAK